jgi:hypothetical protein
MSFGVMSEPADPLGEAFRGVRWGSGGSFASREEHAGGGLLRRLKFKHSVLRLLQRLEEGCGGVQYPRGGEDLRIRGTGGIARWVHAVVQAAGERLLREPFAQPWCSNSAVPTGTAVGGAIEGGGK